jgi:hypothetical protein
MEPKILTCRSEAVTVVKHIRCLTGTLAQISKKAPVCQSLDSKMIFPDSFRLLKKTVLYSLGIFGSHNPFRPYEVYKT